MDMSHSDHSRCPICRTRSLVLISHTRSSVGTKASICKGAVRVTWVT